MVKKSDINKKILDQAIDWSIRLRESNLTVDQEQLFFKWLEESDQHSAAYILAEDLWKRGDAVSQAKQVNCSKSVGTRWPAPLLWASSVAAAIVIVLVVFLSTGINLPKDGVDNIAYSTNFGEFLSIQLSDGSTVNLNSNSQIKVKVLGKNKRVIELARGEAFFDVIRNDRSPFSVYTQKGNVTALGTKFSVDSTSGGLNIVVTSGRVAFAVENDDLQKQTIIEANQKLVIDTIGDQKIYDGIGASLAWRDKRLVFRGESLSQVVKELGRYIENPIFITDKSIETSEVYAVISLDDSPESILDSLVQSQNLRLSKENGSPSSYEISSSSDK